MSEKNEIKINGIGLSGIMFLILFALKLGVGHTSVMNWSWWWVCSPLWISSLFIILIISIPVIIIGIIFLIIVLFDK